MLNSNEKQNLQKKAYNLYLDNKGKDEVEKIILDSGVSKAEAISLQEEFAENFKFIMSEGNRIKKKNAPIEIITGSVILFIGLSVSLISSFGSGSVSVIWYGAIIGGIIILGKALIAKYS